MGFPEQLKRARLNMEFTQQHVADLMGISKSTYCGYETGKRQPDVAKIKQLSSILNTSGDILLETGIDMSKKQNQQEHIYHLCPKEETLISDFRNLNEQGQNYILQTMDMVKDKYKKSTMLSDMEKIV